MQRTVIEVPYVESVFALKMMFKQQQGRAVRPNTVQQYDFTNFVQSGRG